MEGSVFVNGMLRVINAEKALKLCKCKGEGSLTLKLTDPILEENRDTFRLSFSPDTENRVERVNNDPDIILNIGDFSTLLCGVRSAEELPWIPAAEIKNPGASFEKVFYRKPCHVLDLF